MTDTVTRLMGLADVYADRFHEERKRHTPETVHDRGAARQALHDELVRLFTEAQLREALAQQEATMGISHSSQCQCKDHPAGECPGAWEPGCDLGSNEAHAVPANQCDGCMAGLPLRSGLHIDTDGKALMLCQKSKYQADELKQLQEQNTYLDKVASELHDTCDRQAVQLRSIGNLCAKQSVTIQSNEAVMRMALELLGPQAPECCGCAAEWNEAIKALEEQLK